MMKCVSVVLLACVAVLTEAQGNTWIVTDGKDAEIRSNAPDEPIGVKATISVDLQDGTNPDGTNAQTNGLLSFNLTGITQVEQAFVNIFTVSPTSGLVSAHRMKVDWSHETATWNSFGGNGISSYGALPDGIEAESVVSWQWDAPASSELVRVDVTQDVKAWVEGGVPNYGWVFFQDSNDGWDFASFEASQFQPYLEITSLNPAPTASPTVFDPLRPTGTPTYAEGQNIITVTTAVDTTIRSDEPHIGDSFILVEAEDDYTAQGLLKFDFPDFASNLRRAYLELLTISSTSGTITAYRMLQPWDSDALWETFGGDGIQNDGIEAAVEPSFTIAFPRSLELFKVDVSNDVHLWVTAEARNYGWVFISDSDDSWTFNAADADYILPTLLLTTDVAVPSIAPTPVPEFETLSLPAFIDTSIRAGEPDTTYEALEYMWIDQTGSGGLENQGLIQFSLAGVSEVLSAELQLVTVFSSRCNIVGHKMLVPWDANATWNFFGNGVVTDDIIAAATPTFNITGGSAAGQLVKVDVTTEVQAMFNGDADNYGWALMVDCGDSLGFATLESTLDPPMLKIGQAKAPLFTTEWQFATDTEIRSNFPDTPYGDNPRISVDLSDGTNPDGSRAYTMGLLKFDLTGLTSIRSVWLRIFTVSRTSGTISAHRMLQFWDSESTFSMFGGDGIQADDIEAEAVPSFQEVAPQAGEYVMKDVTNDVLFWMKNPQANRGWVFLTDSNDGWDWTTAEGDVEQPTLVITSADMLPTSFPTFAYTPPEILLDGAFDVHVDSAQADVNLGSSMAVEVMAGSSLGLLKFDVSSIETIRSATLSLTVTTPGNVTAYRMISQWEELTATWTSIGSGILFDDVIAASVPSFTLSADTAGAVVTADVTVDVSIWVVEPDAVNQGWVLVADDGSFAFVAADDADNGPPLLSVLGTLPAPTAYPTGEYKTLVTDVIDAEIRSSLPDTPLGLDATTISVDLSTGGAVTNGLMKFNLDGFPSTGVSKATIEVLTVSSTSGTVTGYRMLQDWDENATWGIFVDGIQEDDVEASSTPSFQLVEPQAPGIEQIDVTADVNAWLVDGEPNYGWVFLTDSNDGWDFNTKQANLFQPTLAIWAEVPLPTSAPTTSTTTSKQILDLAEDTEIRADRAETPLGAQITVNVDLSSGGAETQGLLKFDVSAIKSASSATLKLFTTSSTSGTVSAHRMIQKWNQDTVTWNAFRKDGIQADDVEAEGLPSFQLVAPRYAQEVVVDVLADVEFWISNGIVDNQGWVFLTDSNDGWSFFTGEGEFQPPTLTIGITEITEDITEDTTWSQSVLLTKQIFVQPGATLTIMPGVIVSADSDDGSGMAPALIVLPNAKLVADGTVDQPITFQAAANAVDLPRGGLWGGLIIMGNAPVYEGSQEVEGITGVTYGGTDATESSGTLRYVRVWYGGSVIGANNEINGVTLAGVGSGTTVEHIEVAFNLDDGIEFFGGTANAKYLSILFCGDDAIDTDLGYQGKIQYAYVMIGEGGNHGVEMDSKGDATPRSFPQLYSATFVHHLNGDADSVSSDDLFSATLRLREGTAGEFGNLIVTNIPFEGLRVNDCSSAVTLTHELPTSGSDYLWFSSNTIMFGARGINLYDLDDSCSGSFTDAIQTDPKLAMMPGEAEDDTRAFDPRPLASSPAFANVDSVPSDGFFDSVTYKGAFDSENLWIKDYTWLALTLRLASIVADSDITQDTVWDSSVRLAAQVYVLPGVTLKIRPGVTILADRDDGNGNAPALIVLPGAKIIASGTSDRPITFSTVATEAEIPETGLWGGVIIMGNAPVLGGQQAVEGLTGVFYGGSDATEDSGTLRYVRIWYGGAAIAIDNEINGLTLAGVGSSTVVEYVEVAFNFDDAFEMFGGTVDLRYILALFAGDDGLDTDLGYQGRIQFAFVLVGSAGHHAAEMDGKIDATPRSFPRLFSSTLVHHVFGNPKDVAADTQFSQTMRLREGTGGEFGNLIVTNVPNAGVYQQDCGSEKRTHILPRAQLRPNYLWFSSNTIIYGAQGIQAFSLDNCDGLNTSISVDPMLNLMPGEAEPDSPAYDPRPRPGSPAYDDVDPTPPEPFFTATNYKGAFDTELWMMGWSWLSDNQKVVTQSVEGNITESVEWSDSVLLTGQVFVLPGATLTLKAGITVVAEKLDSSLPAPAVVILPGAKIMAAGTSDKPITFTTTVSESLLPDRGLWGGLIIMGKAPVYQGEQVVEGLEGYTYGGSDATDDSGVLTYVRVWHGGSVIAAGNEINGITFAGVGSGTTVNNVEVAFNLDDGIEFFGGSVNVKYASVLFCDDDAIDSDLGYVGKIQFAYIMTGKTGHHALEMDSTIDGTPRSFPQLYHATIIHSLNAALPDEPTVNLREGTGGEFANIIVTNVPSKAIHQDSCGSETRTHVKPASGQDYLWFSSNNIVYGADNITTFDLDASCAGLDTVILSNPRLEFVPESADEDAIGFDPRPKADSIAFEDVDDTPDDDFFEAAPYKGAFSTSGNWLNQWSWLDQTFKLIDVAF